MIKTKKNIALKVISAVLLASVVTITSAGCGGNESKSTSDNKSNVQSVSESSEAEEKSFKVTTVSVKEIPFDKDVFGEDLFEETDAMKIITIAAESIGEPDDKINYIAVNIVEPPVAAPVTRYVSDIYPVIDSTSQQTKGYITEIICPAKYSPSDFKINYQHKDYFTHSTLSDTIGDIPSSLVSDGQTTPYSVFDIDGALYYRDNDKDTVFTKSDDSTSDIYEASIYLLRLDGTTDRQLDAAKCTYEPAEDVAKDKNYSRFKISFANEDAGAKKSVFSPIGQSIRFTVVGDIKDVATNEEFEAIDSLLVKIANSGSIVYDGKVRINLG